MGAAFAPYAAPVYERCTSIVHKSLLQYQAYQQNPETDEPDKSFLVVALDLLSGLTQGLGMALETLIANGQPNLVQLLTVCLKHPQAPVRQSAYALVGDMAMHCFPLLKPHTPAIMHELIEQLDPEPKVEFVSACNNAAWSVGEIALRYGRGKPSSCLLDDSISCALQTTPNSVSGSSPSSRVWCLFSSTRRHRVAFTRTPRSPLVVSA